MNDHAGRLTAIILLMGSFLLTLSCATQNDSPSRLSTNGVERSSSVENPASGTQGDSLKVCRSRIPSDASAGQRMFAEQSCERDEANRKSLQSVPGN